MRNLDIGEGKGMLSGKIIEAAGDRYEGKTTLRQLLDFLLKGDSEPEKKERWKGNDNKR